MCGQAARGWRVLVGVAVVLAFWACSAPLQAQPASWPTKPVRVVVGFAPGGGTDVMARVVAQGLSDALGKTFIVDNKPGVSGNLAVGEVVRAAPDGYTLMVAPTSVETANPSLFKANFHPAKSLTPVGSIGVTAMYIVARPDFAAKDAKELVDYGKANPGKLSYASSGAGTPPHLAAELFKLRTGIFATHIPYRGSAPALQDVMASQADYVFDGSKRNTAWSPATTHRCGAGRSRTSIGSGSPSGASSTCRPTEAASRRWAVAQCRGPNGSRMRG